MTFLQWRIIRTLPHAADGMRRRNAPLYDNPSSVRHPALMLPVSVWTCPQTTRKMTNKVCVLFGWNATCIVLCVSFMTFPYMSIHSSTFQYIPIPLHHIIHINTYTGWWFGTFFIVHNMWDVILPIDELHHFSRWLEPPTSYGSSEIIIDLYESHINHIILTILIFTILITSYHKLTTIYINHIILIPMVQHASLAPGLCSGAWASPSDGGFFKTCGAMGAQVANYNHQMQWPKAISG